MNSIIKRSAWIAVATMAYLVSTLSTQAASFDCAKAATKVEKLICSDADLSKLDEELSVAYKTALQEEKQADSVKQAQKQWMKERNGGSDAACVKRAYEARLSSFTATNLSSDGSVTAKQKITPPAQGGDWTCQNDAGKNELLCQNLLKRLNYYYRQNELLDEQCSWDVIASYNKFEEPPWADLDPKKHKELLVKLVKYDQEGVEGYFHLRPDLKEQNPDSVYRARAEEFIDDGGRLRMWRTRLVQHSGTEQTIVQMWIPWKYATESQNRNRGKPCIGKQKFSWMGGGYAVTADLNGPDPNVDPDTHGIVNRHQLVMYDGKPLLINGKDVWRGSELKFDRLCDFKFVNRGK